MEPSIGWPHVAMALIGFAKADPVLFLITVPITGIVILAGAMLFLGIFVIGPISAFSQGYRQTRRVHRESARTPELPLK